MKKHLKDCSKYSREYVEFLRYVYSEKPGFVIFSVFATILNNTSAFSDIVFLKFLLDGITNFNIIRITIVVILYGIYMLLIPTLTNLISARRLPILQQSLVFSMKKNIFFNAENVDLECFDDAKYLDAVSMALQTVENQGLGIVESVSSVASMILNITILTAIVSIVNPLLIIMSVFMALLTYYYGVRQSKQDMLTSEKLTPLYRKSNYYQSIFINKRYAKELRIYEAQNLFKKHYDQNCKKCVEVLDKQGRKIIVLLLKNQLFGTMINLFVIVYLVTKAVISDISVGEMVAALGGTQQLAIQLVGFSSSIASLTRYGMTFSKYREFIIPQKNKKKVITPKESISKLEFRNVDFKYKKGDSCVLKNINFTIKGGSSVAFIGENGSGKSTLIKLLCGFYAPTDGDICIDGEAIRTKDKLSSNCVAVFQDFIIYSISIAENILMRPFNPDSSNDIAILNDALEFSGLAEKIANYKKGVNAIVSKEFNEDGIILSEGEKQRLAIARIYVQNKPIVIFDETTSALDYLSEKNIVIRLNKRFKNSIIIWISHRPECLKAVDNIYYIEHGHIQEHGRYDELLNQNSKLKIMYQ